MASPPPGDPPPSEGALDGDAGFFEVAYTTRALRRFRPDPIPQDVLFQILDAAIRAPSGQNAQDWRFVIVTDPAVKRRMQEWALQGWATYSRRYADDPAQLDALPRSQRLSLRSVEHLAHHLADAPAVVLVCGLHGRHSTPGGSSYPAVQNLLLAARALGVGGSIFNLPLRDRAALKTMLDIPENNDIFCVLPIGYPTDTIGPVRRKPVKRVVYWEKFGQAWDFAAAQPDDGWGERWIPDDV